MTWPDWRDGVKTVLLLGSAPMAAEARHWPNASFDRIVAINNAWRIRPDWTHAIYPWDFPPDRHPVAGPGQTLIIEDDFVPAQNAYGGFVYGGATMAYTAAYWILHALRPRVIAVFGCNMHYPATGATHFYGTADGTGRTAGLRGGQPVNRAVAAGLSALRAG